jgi:hypothetical protein
MVIMVMVVARHTAADGWAVCEGGEVRPQHTQATGNGYPCAPEPSEKLIVIITSAPDPAGQLQRHLAEFSQEVIENNAAQERKCRKRRPT